MFELFDEDLEVSLIGMANDSINTTILESTSWIDEKDSNHYVTKMTGFFVPPKTGNYSFYIKSDDQSELHLDLQDDQTNLVKFCVEI